MAARRFILVAGALLTGIALGGGGIGAADNPARVLLDQARQLNQTTRKWEDSSQRMNVTIRDRRGGERQRSIELFVKKYAADATRTILFFRAPPEVRGIGFLQWVAPHEPDRQWLYLPALKRVRQITGASKQESFVGTDFSYEDLSIRAEIIDWTDEDGTVTLVADEEYDGHPCAVIDVVPKDPDVGYGKIRVWLGRDDHVIHKYQFEDRTGKLMKTLLVSDVRVVANVPTAYRLEMRNERTGGTTVVVYDDVVYNTGLTDAMFSERELEHGGRGAGA